MELLVLDNNNWSYLTVCKQMSSDLFKNNVTYKLLAYKLKIWYECINRIWLKITRRDSYAI